MGILQSAFWLLDRNEGSFQLEQVFSLRLGTPLVKLIARWRKVLKGTTTLQANWRVPMSDCNSSRRTERHNLKEFNISWILESLS